MPAFPALRAADCCHPRLCPIRPYPRRPVSYLSRCRGQFRQPVRPRRESHSRAHWPPGGPNPRGTWAIQLPPEKPTARTTTSVVGSKAKNARASPSRLSRPDPPLQEHDRPVVVRRRELGRNAVARSRVREKAVVARIRDCRKDAEWAVRANRPRPGDPGAYRRVGSDFPVHQPFSEFLRAHRTLNRIVVQDIPSVAHVWPLNRRLPESLDFAAKAFRPHNVQTSRRWRQPGRSASDTLHRSIKPASAGPAREVPP